MNIIVYKMGTKQEFSFDDPNINGNQDLFLTIQSILACTKNTNIYLLDTHRTKNVYTDKRVNLIVAPDKKDPNFFVKYFKKENIKIDLFIVFSGMAFLQSMSGIFMSDKGTYYKTLEAAVWNYAPFNFINQSDAPLIFVNNDPKHIAIRPRDLREPAHILTQNENLGDFIQWKRFEDLEFVSKPEPRKFIIIPTKYSYGLNDTIVAFGQKDRIKLEDKYGPDNLGLSIICNKGKDKWREEELSKYIKDIDNCSIYGNIESDDPRFKGIISINKVNEILQRSRYSLCIPIGKKWITSKWLECIMNGCLPFLHPEYAFAIKDENKPWPIDMNEILYVKSPTDLKKRVDYLDKNPEVYKRVMLELFKIVNNRMMNTGEAYLSNIFNSANVYHKIEWFSEAEIDQNIEAFNKIRYQSNNNVLEFE